VDLFCDAALLWNVVTAAEIKALFAHFSNLSTEEKKGGELIIQ
jgi:hypothetical protein